VTNEAVSLHPLCATLVPYGVGFWFTVSSLDYPTVADIFR